GRRGAQRAAPRLDRDAAGAATRGARAQPLPRTQPPRDRVGYGRVAAHRQQPHHARPRAPASTGPGVRTNVTRPMNRAENRSMPPPLRLEVERKPPAERWRIEQVWKWM